MARRRLAATATTTLATRPACPSRPTRRVIVLLGALLRLAARLLAPVLAPVDWVVQVVLLLAAADRAVVEVPAVVVEEGADAEEEEEEVVVEEAHSVSGCHREMMIPRR